MYTHTRARAHRRTHSRYVPTSSADRFIPYECIISRSSLLLRRFFTAVDDELVVNYIVGQPVGYRSSSAALHETRRDDNNSLSSLVAVAAAAHHHAFLSARTRNYPRSARIIETRARSLSHRRHPS